MLRKLQTKDVIRPEPAPPILAACLSRLPRAGEPGQWRGRFTLNARPDGHSRRGGELLGRRELVPVDIDTPAAAADTPSVSALRWLADRAVEAGGCLTCPPGCPCAGRAAPGSGHFPGWQL